jgi:hypothetical protein
MVSILPGFIIAQQSCVRSSEWQLAGSREANWKASGTRLDIEENEIFIHLVYSDILLSLIITERYLGSPVFSVSCPWQKINNRKWQTFGSLGVFSRSTLRKSEKYGAQIFFLNFEKTGDFYFQRDRRERVSKSVDFNSRRENHMSACFPQRTCFEVLKIKLCWSATCIKKGNL